MKISHVVLFAGLVPGFGSRKSGIPPFFGNVAKSGSGQISSRIWQIPVQLQYVQLITDKIITKLMQLICQVWIRNNLITLCYSKKDNKNTKSVAIPQIPSKTGKLWCDKGSTELYCLFVAADSVDDAIYFYQVYCSVIPQQVLAKSGSISGWIWVPKSDQVIWNSRMFFCHPTNSVKAPNDKEG